MKAEDAFPSKYLKSSELEGRTLPAVIEHCVMEKVGEDHKPVIYFQHMKKGLVCNRTNWDNIELLYGPDSDDWGGKEVVLFTEMTRYQGKMVEGIRVRGPDRKAPVARVQNGVRPTPPRPRSSGNFVVDPPVDDVPPWEPDR